jgi:SAM-dependent methyltransferase
VSVHGGLTFSGEGSKLEGTSKDYGWCLGPPNTGYPGAFPRGLVNAVRRKWWGLHRCWLFSGTFKDPGQTTVDIKPEVKPSVVANCEELPFKSDSFDFVFLDPPYSEEEAKRLYNLPYVSMPKALNEAARICRQGGHVLVLHEEVWFIHPSFREFKELELVGLVGIVTIARGG